MKWQEHFLEEALKVDSKGQLVRRMTGLVVPRQNGKSHLARMRVLAGLFLFDESWVIVAQNLKLSLEHFEEMVKIIDSYDWLRSQVARVRKTNGNEYIELKSGAKVSIAAATKDGARGMTGNLWVDELREITPEAWKASTPVTTTGKKQILWTSNAGDAHSTVLNEVRARSLTTTDPSTLIMEWSSDPQLKPSDVRAWYQANPALGYNIDESTIRQFQAMSTPEGFLTEHLCRWVDAIQSAWPNDAFRKCAVDDMILRADRPTVLAIDVSPDRTRADLVGGQILDDGRMAISIMQTWTADFAVDDIKIAADVSSWARKYSAQVIAFDKWTSANIAQRLSSAKFYIADTSGATFHQACDETLSAMTTGRLAHDNSETLVDQFNACIRKESADGGWRVIRRGTQIHISAACAAIMVIHHLSKPQRVADIFIA